MCQTCVTQMRFAEFGACPIVDVVFPHQSPMPLQPKGREVNTGASRLQEKLAISSIKLWVILSA
ncbi:MAG: unnamed protein product [uncultured Caballeronia sp.]|nr:MAG: unnamed protein product [uncultured Caballeronia sp.]